MSNCDLMWYMHGDTFPWNVLKFQRTIIECIYNTHTKFEVLFLYRFQENNVSTRKSIFSMIEVECLHRLN